MCVQYQSSCAPKLARKCWIEHWFPCSADGRAAGGRCTVTWLPNFLGWVDLLTHGAPQARFARQSSAMIWLAYVLLWMTYYLPFENLRHFKIVLLSQRRFALLWFLILDSYSFATVILVLLFRQSWNVLYVVIRRIWRTVITVKANGEIRSLWIEASYGIPQTLCHKIAKCWAMIKSKW